MFGLRDVTYWMLQGGSRGIDTPVGSAIEDMARAARRLQSAIVQGDPDKLWPAMEAVIGSWLKLLGVPYWTPRGYIDGIIGRLSD